MLAQQRKEGRNNIFVLYPEIKVYKMCYSGITFHAGSSPALLDRHVHDSDG